MKFMLMLMATQADYEAMGGTPSAGSPAWTEADRTAMSRFMDSVNNDLQASGEFVDGQGLSEPSEARAVTADKDGLPVLSDDGYGVAEEVLAGYWLLECEGVGRATEIAARIQQCPAPEGSVNSPVIVRPVQEAPPVG